MGRRKKQNFKPVQMQIERTPKVLFASEWVCCMDCGLLMHQKSINEPQWSVCDACQRVYTEIKDAWLVKMLVKRMTSNTKILEKYMRVLKKNLVYLCEDCKRFYLAIEGYNKTQCKWCFLIEKQTLKRINSEREKQCIVCGVFIEKQLICDSCLKQMNIVKQSMEYVYYINWIGRYKRQASQILGRKRLRTSGENMEKIK